MSDVVTTRIWTEEELAAAFLVGSALQAAWATNEVLRRLVGKLGNVEHERRLEELLAGFDFYGLDGFILELMAEQRSAA